MFKKKRTKKLFSKTKPGLSKSNQGLLIAYRKGYRVTENGNILNPDGKELSLSSSSGKYPTVSVMENTISYNVPVHRLAAYCFFGKELFRQGLLVRHLNGNVLDVRKSNIALGTYTQNSMDRPMYQRTRVASTGRQAQKRPHNARFSEDEVRLIRGRREKGETLQSIATTYGVSRQTINRIVKRIAYSDVE
jgi:hypothetical protein